MSVVTAVLLDGSPSMSFSPNGVTCITYLEATQIKIVEMNNFFLYEWKNRSTTGVMNVK